MKFLLVNILLILVSLPCYSQQAGIPMDVTQQGDLATVDENVDKPEKQLEEQSEKNKNVESNYRIFDNKDITTLNSGFKSILFKQEDLSLLYDSLLEKPRPTQDIKNLVDKVADAGAKNNTLVITDTSQDNYQTREVDSPTFFLKTVIFPEDGSWTLWYNSEKVRKEQVSSQDNPRIEKVYNDKVVFLYKTEGLAQLSPNYTSILKPVEAGSKYSKEGGFAWDFVSDKGDILFDSTQGFVRFKIGVNQTFSLYDAKIFEGYKAPTKAAIMIDGSYTEQPTGSETAATPAEPVQPETPADVQPATDAAKQ